MTYDRFHTRSLISVMSATWWLCACESTTITASYNSSAGGTVALAQGGSSVAPGGNGATVSVAGAAVTSASAVTSTAGATSVGTSNGGTTSSPAAGAASTITTSPGGGVATGGMATGGTAAGGMATGGTAAGGTAAGGMATGGAGGPAIGGAAAAGGTSSVLAMGGTSTGGVAVGGTVNGGTTSGVANGGSPPIAGAAGSAGAMPCTAVAALLHGNVEPLSGNLCRVTYDFSTQNQLLDWSIIDATGTKLEIANQLMLVTYIQSPLNLAAILFKLPLRTSRLTFRGTVLEGDQHINAYLAVQWNGNWAPEFGYGCIHYYGGRMFTAAGGSIQTSDTTSLVMNQTYNVEIAMTSNQIRWSIDNNAVTYDSVYLYQGKDRHLVLGSWRSSVAFDDLVIEGEF